jgi:hypothetical protein
VVGESAIGKNPSAEDGNVLNNSAVFHWNVSDNALMTLNWRDVMLSLVETATCGRFLLPYQGPALVTSVFTTLYSLLVESPTILTAKTTTTAIRRRSKAYSMRVVPQQFINFLNFPMNEPPDRFIFLSFLTFPSDNLADLDGYEFNVNLL